MMRPMIPLLLTVLLSIPSTARGQMPGQMESLRGIEAFQVFVSVSGECPSESEMRRVEASLRGRLEVSLRREGIGISTVESPEVPLLTLHLHALREQTAPCAYMFQLGLHEVGLWRGRTAMVATWQRAGVAMVGESNFRDGTLSALDGVLTYFLNDYLTANPKG